MDPISSATTFATIASLVVDFVSERRAENDATLEEFKSWLSDQRHEGVVRLLNSTNATAIGIKALLHESRDSILKRMDSLERNIGSAGAAESNARKAHAISTELIWLGVNNAFVGGDEELRDLSTRCAIDVINGRTIKFKVRLEPTALASPPPDPLLLPRYEKARQQKAEMLTARLELLTSQAAIEWWQYFLNTPDEWAAAFESLLALARLGAVHSAAHKIDVWRTTSPELSAPIYLSPSELERALAHMGFSSTKELRFGSHWRAVVDLPFDLIAKHALPSIVVQLVRSQVPPEGEVLNLADWHIGDG